MGNAVNFIAASDSFSINTWKAPTIRESEPKTTEICKFSGEANAAKKNT